MAILKNKILLGLLVATSVGALLYWWSSTSSSPVLTQEDSSPLSTDFLATLGNLTTIELNESIFTDETFRTLTDFGVTIPPQATGRRNPFAPI